MNKKIIIGIIIVLVLFIIIFIVFKPRYELNKAVKYIEHGDYKEAHEYIQSKNNEENKIIVKELITEIFFNKAGKGIQKVGNIISESTNVVRKVNLDDIDYTLDDNINIEVKALDAYINLENEITKDMIDKKMQESYDLYFSIIKYVNKNFYDVLNHIYDNAFIDKVSSLSSDMTKVANDCYSYADNHTFNKKSEEIYKKISK